MSYPTAIDSYVTKINKNASGWYVPVDNITVPSIAPFELYFDHVPASALTTSIPGFTQAVSPPGPNQYTLDLIYGKVEFNLANAGDVLVASYYSLGDDIMAEHMNEVQGDIVKIETELGTLPAGAYASVKARLNAVDVAIAASGIDGQRITDFTVRPGALETNTGWAGRVGAVSPGATAITTVQGHIDRKGNKDQVMLNPHGVSIVDTSNGWNDNLTFGDITVRDIYAERIYASGNVFSFNFDGPDGDQSLYFYDEGVEGKQHLQWDNSNGQFQLSSGLKLANVLSSGNIMPTASGLAAGVIHDEHTCVGTISVPFASGNFEVLQASSFMTGESVGANGTFTAGAQTVTVLNGLIVSIV